ncbi:type I restriction enzyme S subunit [Lacibacter cauensis]|uniref:Type I restriction enzyme S subunit n=1 Tax=Lacibacter cauensis TaxID=510947 RepID=A0A562SCM9_9BACT|nr:restriction endonuclease subunit S [Lacibacter cauensis]TWI79028.1 type I restriction enzyme S subunit [Lacibacter cauensis]
MKQAAGKNKVEEDKKTFYNLLIPADWEISTVGVAFEICNNLRFPISEEERKKIKGIYPYYGPTKVQDYINEYRLDGKYVLIGEDGDHFLKWKELPMTLLVEGKFNVNNHAHVIKGSKNITEWFFYYFNHKELTPYLTRQGAGRYKLTKNSLENIPIPLPPIFEQKAIAAILGSCDLNIKIVELLIVQKELRKKWLIKQLLTGKKRIEGFAEEWKEVHIRDIANEVSIRNKTDKQLTVLSCTKYSGLVPSLEYFGRRIFADDVSPYKIVPKNHFAYATNHIEEGSIGYQESYDEALISPMYTVFKTDKSVNDHFFYRLLKSHPLVYQYQNRMEGSIDRRGGLRWDAFSIIKIHLPSLEEQAAIAKILLMADKEISLLKSKVEKLRQKKKGLMQQLLTGKTRIK